MGPELIELTAGRVRIIKERLKTTQSWQKSYVDIRRRDLKFQVGDQVFVKISPSRGIMRFGKRGKLSPRYVGPFKIVTRVGEVAYRVALPDHMAAVHNVFHVSMLRKYIPDPSHVIDLDPLEIREDLTLVEQPVRILDMRDQVLRTKTIPLVLVQWQHHSAEEATWEREADVRDKFPHLFV